MTAQFDDVLGLGMGVESVAIALLSMNKEIDFGADPSRTLYLTAVTGNEYSSTHAAMSEFIVPRMERHGIRWVQVARTGQYEREGIDVLSDAVGGRVATRGRVHLAGENRAAGTVVQVTKPRKCALKWKGFPLDLWLRRNLSGQFRHAIGFNADELDRIATDSKCYGAGAGRIPTYPLHELGWSRQDCADYIYEQLGIVWKKSCCTFCPFQPVGQDNGGQSVAERWAAEPDAAVDTLIAEVAALALNPRAMVFKDITAAQFVERFALADIRRRADEALATMPWSVAEVRRVVPPTEADASRKAPSWRSVHIITTCSRDEAREQVGKLSVQLKAIDLEDGQSGIRRAWIRKAGPKSPPPVIEHLYVAAPAGMVTKERGGFQKVWNRWSRPQAKQASLFTV